MNTRLDPTLILRQLLAGAALLTANGFCETGLFAQELPLIHQDNFEADDALAKWFPTQADKWKITDTKSKSGKVLHLLGSSSAYKPPFRSPHSITLLKGKVVGDFVLTAKVQTLQTARGHRDMCLFFGWQDPSHFYYVHLGEKPDPNSSQIFIVKDAPRTPITETNAGGIPWKDGRWHDVKLVRNIKDGLIAVYFDDMQTPVKVAHDKTFQWGLLGLGSFDDLGQWDDVVIRGVTITGQKPVLPNPKRAASTQQK
ncbi:MAG: hypothetical protein O3A00_20100 [Planctomycetota bacterium]|nr:hypothetical protein [Planctomycetota bacterium]